METKKDIISKGLRFCMRDKGKSKFNSQRVDTPSFDSETFLERTKIGSLNSHSVQLQDRLVGSVLGFAIGDALGAPVEFKKKFNKISGYEHAYSKGLSKGQFTDDTQHLEIALDSIIALNGEFDLEDHSKRLIRWYRSGDARSIGQTTKLAIEKLIAGVEPTKSGMNKVNYCGSLGVARLVPYSLLSAVSCSKHKLERVDIKKILGITHSHKYVLQMGELINYFVQEGMHGRSIKSIIDMISFEDEFLNKRIRQKLSTILKLADSKIEANESIETIGSGGFVEEVIFSAIYSALKGNSFEEAVLIAANAGGDSDSRASYTGTLWGLQTGKSGIPFKFKKGLERSDELEIKAKRIYYLKR